MNGICKGPVRGKNLSLTGFFILALVLFNGACGLFSTRPNRHLSYAEAAFTAAQKAGAETASSQTFQLARETLYKARSYYRLKNFKLARQYAVRARLLAEDAEFKARFKDVDVKENPKTNPEE